MASRWTEAEERKLLRAVRGSSSREDMVAKVAVALPHRELSMVAIEMKLGRLGKKVADYLSATSVQGAKKAKDDRGELIARFAKVAKKGVALDELCDDMDMSPSKVRALVVEAKKRGYSIDVAGDGRVGYVPPRPLQGEKRLIAQPGEEHIFAVTSDIHIGSKYCLEDQFVDFVQNAYAEGVRTVFVPGDILDGCYGHSKWDESHHGFHAQAKRAAQLFPRLPGLKYRGIIGNHDETFEKDSGMSVVHSLPEAFRTEGREDFELYGARGAYFRFAPKGGRGVLVELWHPIGGGAYAVSYKLQRHVEEYGVGQKPDILLTGHWHQQCYIVRRGVHCFSCGTFHGGGSSFGKALGGAPAIGGWVIRFKQTKDGTVRDLQPSWRGYYETESVRDLGLG